MASNSKNLAELLNSDVTLTATDIANGAVTTAKIANTVNLGKRNLIINGAMQVAQRGNGSGVGDAGYIGVDRWRGYISTSSTIYFTQTAFAAGQSDVDKNLRHYLRFDWLGTGSPQTKILNQRIEGVEKGNGQNVTLSFWGRTEQADDCTLKLIQNFGSGGSSQTETSSGTIDLTTSWKYFTHTFALPSTSGKAVGTTDFLDLQFIFGPATLNSYFDITGVQLEYGDTATSFEHISYEEELSRCQRYYFKSGQQWMSGQSYGVSNSLDGLIMPIYWPTTMRANPSVSFSGGSDGGSGAALYTAYVEEEGMSVNLRSTNAYTSVWWSGFRVTADSEL